VFIVLAGLFVNSLIARSIQDASLSKIPGCFVYLDNDKVRIYRPGEGKVNKKEYGSIEESSVLLSSDHPSRNITFLNKYSTSGLLQVSKNGSSVKISPDNKLSDYKPGNITRWRVSGDKLYTVKYQNRQAVLMSFDKDGHIDNIKLMLPSKIKPQEDWCTAPSIHNETQIIFSVPVVDRRSLMVLVDTSNDDVKVLGEGFNPEWSPDGSLIAFTYGLTLKVMDVDTSKVSSYEIWRPRTFIDRLFPFRYSVIVSNISWLGGNEYVACALVPASMAWQHQIAVIHLPTKSSYQLPISVDPVGWAWVPDSQ